MSDCDFIDADACLKDVQNGCAIVYPIGKSGSCLWEPPQWLDALISADKVSWGSGSTQTTSTDPDGSFVTGGAADTHLTVIVRVPGSPWAFRTDASADPGDHEDLGSLVLPALRDLQVVVSDSRGAPIEGADVRVGVPISALALRTGDDRPRYEFNREAEMFVAGPLVHTDRSGEAQSRVPLTDRTFVCARGPGEVAWSIHRVAAPMEHEMRIVLDTPLALRVRLQDSKQNPISGTIRVFAATPTFGPCPDLLEVWSFLAPSTLAAQHRQTQPGSYQIEGFRPGEYIVRASAAGWASAEATVKLAGQQEAETVFSLQAIQPLQVRVVSLTKDGTLPVEGARVSWSPAGSHGARTFGWGTAYSDKYGLVSIVPETAAGPISVLVRHPDFADAQELVDAGTTGPVPIEMPIGSNLDGRIHRGGRDPAGRHVIEVSTKKSSANDARQTTQTVLADEHGRFRCSYLLPGTYEIRTLLRPANTSPESSGPLLERREIVKTVTLDETTSESIDIDVDVERSRMSADEGLVEGTILRDSQPYVQAWVRIKRHDHSLIDIDRKVGIERAGEFDSGPLPAGQYCVSVDVSNPEGGFITFFERVITVTPGDVVTVDANVLTGGPIRGVVKSAEDGRTLADADIRIYPKVQGPSGEAILGQFMFEADTSENGDFVCEHLPVGSYRVIAEDGGRFPTSVEITVQQGIPIDRLELRLSEGPLVEGKVRLAGRTGIASADLRFELESADDPRDDPRDSFMEYVEVDTQTLTFHSRGLIPGLYRVYLEARTDAKQKLTSKGVEVRIPAGGIRDLVLSLEPEELERR